MNCYKLTALKLKRNQKPVLKCIKCKKHFNRDEMVNLKCDTNPFWLCSDCASKYKPKFEEKYRRKL